MAKLIAKSNWYSVTDPHKLDKRTVWQEKMVKKSYAHLKALRNRIEVDESCKKIIESMGKEVIKERLWEEEKEYVNRYKPRFLETDESAVLNSTNIAIPEDVFTCLSFGPKFLFPSSQDAVSLLMLIAEAEDIIENNVEMGVDMARIKLKNICMPEQRNTQNSAWLNFILKRTKRFFQEHSEIIAVKSDKGKKFIVMNRNEYKEKMNALILSSDYEEIVENKDKLLDKLIKRNHAYTRVMIRLKVAREFETKSDKNCEFADAYGLPKPHKKGMPLRMIIAFMNAPGHNLSKLVLKVLKEAFPPKEMNLKNSLDLKRRIDGVIVGPNEVLVSFDIISMFTSIPVWLVIQILRENIDKIAPLTNNEPECLIKIIEFILTDCAVFKANGKVYKQKGGIGMGGVISPIIARLVMEHIFEKIQKKLEILPRFLYVFVDDTVCLINKEGIDAMLKELNKFNENIRFTIEYEKNQQINFLDMSLIREGERIKTNWFCKEFASHRLVNFYSSHEEHTVYGTAQTHIETVLNLSDPCYFNENKKKIEKTLKFNNFSEASIVGLLTTYYTLMKNKNNKPPIQSVSNNEFPIINYPCVKLITATKRKETPKTIFTKNVSNDDGQNKFTSIPLVNGVSEDITLELHNWCNKHASGRPIRRYSFTGSMLKDPKEEGKKMNCILRAICQCSKRRDYIDMMDLNFNECEEKYIEKENCTETQHYVAELKPFCNQARKGNQKFINLLKTADENRLINKVKNEEQPLAIWKRLIEEKKEKGVLNSIIKN